MAGKPQQDRRIQKTVPESQTPQGAYPECDKAGDEQCPHWSNQQQDQVDHPQGIRLSKHTKYAGYGVPCMLGFEVYTSQPKIKGHLISINTGIADKKHPPLHPWRAISLDAFYTQKLPEFGNSRTNRNAYHQGVDNKLFTCEQSNDTITPWKLQDTHILFIRF